MIKNLYIIFFTLIFGFNVVAQEQLFPLSTNPSLKVKSKITASKGNLAPVKLPFIDDFSYNSVYPNPNLWISRSAYVNKNFGVNSPTIGVMTFDAVDDTGNVYNHASQFAFIADTVNSNFIRLDSAFGLIATKLSPADSLYFSFYFQPQGLGNAPESEDSLILHFYNPISNQWELVWEHEGLSLDSFVVQYGVEFLKVMIPIVNPDYFKSNFRFRFLNKASIPNSTIPSWRSGMYDQWHIDYVYLNKNRSINENSMDDVGFTTNVMSLLTNYTSMPWNQYKANATAETDLLKTIQFQNFYQGPNSRNMNQYFYIHNLVDDTILYSNPYPAAFNLTPGALTSYSPVLQNANYVFSTKNSEIADFEVMYHIFSNSPPLDLVKSNDTLRFYQRFYNYYSYDDGTPEAGYGLSNAGSRLAYQFTLNQPDTLQSVQIYFNQTLSNANQQYFYLTVWNDNNGKPGNVIYEENGVKPEFEGDLFKFHTYIFDEPIAVSGTIYIGFRQLTPDNLNIGFDLNNDKKSKIFYNTGGNWLNSSFDGALMIRPILGSETEPIVNIKEISDIKMDVIIFPNPALPNSLINIELQSELEVADKKYFLKIFDLGGRLILEKETYGKTTINSIESGFYILSVQSENGDFYVNKKFIVR